LLPLLLLSSALLLLQADGTAGGEDDEDFGCLDRIFMWYATRRAPRAKGVESSLRRILSLAHFSFLKSYVHRIPVSSSTSSKSGGGRATIALSIDISLWMRDPAGVEMVVPVSSSISCFNLSLYSVFVMKP